MGTLRFLMSCSLDGYVNDTDGRIDFSAPSDEVHAFFNDRVRDVRTFVMGRRMYETMRVWDTPWPDGQGRVEQEFAGLWRERDKIVCSGSLGSVGEPRTTLEPRLTTGRLAEIVAATDGAVEVSGPTTAADALRAGMVDELCLVVLPRVLGGGTRALPDGMSVGLDLVEQRALDGGAVFLRYAPLRT